MINAIFFFEFKQLMRKQVLWALCLFVLAGSLYAIWYGWRDYQHYRVQIEEVNTQQAETYAEMAPKYDSLSLLGDQAPEALRNVFGNPIYADRTYLRYSAWLPSSLSALAVGQRDQQTPFQRIQYYRSIYLPVLEEINNPEQLLAGNFDLCFILVFLLPLLVIILGFNTRSQDQESGILALLNVQGASPSQVLFARIALQFMILWLLCILVCTLGFLIVGADWKYWPVWVFSSGIWLMFWAGLVAWVNSWRRSSAFNATVLASFWIILLLLIPALVNFWVDKRYPVLPRSEFMASARDIDYEEWERPVADLLQNFQKLRPDLYAKIPQPIQDTQKIKVILYNEVSKAKIEQLGDPIQRTMAQRLGLENRLKYFNPAYAFQTILTTSAGSELSNFNDWQKATKAVLQQNRDLISQAVLVGKSFKKAEFDQLPTLKATGQKAEIAGNLLCLMLLAGGVWLLVVWNARRNATTV